MILDVSESMNKAYDQKITRLQFGIESIRHLIRQKVFFNKLVTFQTQRQFRYYITWDRKWVPNS